MLPQRGKVGAKVWRLNRGFQETSWLKNNQQNPNFKKHVPVIGHLNKSHLELCVSNRSS